MPSSSFGNRETSSLNKNNPNENNLRYSSHFDAKFLRCVVHSQESNWIFEEPQVSTVIQWTEK